MQLSCTLDRVKITFSCYFTRKSCCKCFRLKYLYTSGSNDKRKKYPSVATGRSSAPIVFGRRRAMRSNRMSRSTLILVQSVERKNKIIKWLANLLACIRRI